MNPTPKKPVSATSNSSNIASSPPHVTSTTSSDNSRPIQITPHRPPNGPLLINSTSKTNKRDQTETMLSQSAPALRYVPPQAPSVRPTVPQREPPPMELPPSPPMFSEVDVQREIEKQQAAKQQQAPLSRSMQDSWAQQIQSFSVPSNLMLRGFTPQFGSVSEQFGNLNINTEDGKMGGSYQESTTPTIYSILKTGSMPNSSAAPPIPVPSAHKPIQPNPNARRSSGNSNANPSRHAFPSFNANDPNEDGLQFSFSLNENEDNALFGEGEGEGEGDADGNHSDLDS